MRIMYAEDETALSMAVQEIFKMEDFEVDPAYDGTEAWELLQKNRYDAAVLDIMMPGMSGIEVLEHMREADDYTPVLLLTAKAETDDRIAGLSSGADDYLAKPFAMGELIARVKALLRRNQQYRITKLSLGNIELDCDSNELKSLQGSLRISNKESELLAMMIRSVGRVMKGEEIANELWKDEADENAVQLYISYLQAKLRQIHSTVNIEAGEEGFCMKEQA